VYDLADDPAGKSAAAKAVEPVVSVSVVERKPERRRPRAASQWNLSAGSFAFPWTPGALTRWLLISTWAATTFWLVRSALAWGIGSPLSGNLYTEILALLTAMGAVLFGTASAAVAAIHGLTILTETSAGNHRIECWPNVAMFVEWAGDVFYIVNAAALSVAPGFALGWLVPGARVPIIGGTVFVLFPILLLCELEANSAFLPVSGLVLASFRRHGPAWLLFFAESGGLLAAAGAFAYFLGPKIDERLGIVLAALLFAAVVMIYFRLLGRLAWCCSVETGDVESKDEGASAE
jgi:hypothetical protein